MTNRLVMMIRWITCLFIFTINTKCRIKEHLFADGPASSIFHGIDYYACKLNANDGLADYLQRLLTARIDHCPVIGM